MMLVIGQLGAVTCWCTDSVALGVEEAAHLHQLAVPLSHVLVRDRLDQIGIVALLYLVDAFLGRLNKVTLIAVHKIPHSLIGLYFGLLFNKILYDN